MKWCIYNSNLVEQRRYMTGMFVVEIILCLESTFKWAERRTIHQIFSKCATTHTTRNIYGETGPRWWEQKPVGDQNNEIANHLSGPQA